MPIITVPVAGVQADYLSQLEYSLTFASEDITSCCLREEDGVIEAQVRTDEACARAEEKLRELVQRYARPEFGLLQAVHFKQDRESPVIDAWNGLLERRWITPVGTGHVILRGPAAKLMSLIDSKVSTLFAVRFDAELEIYPSTIQNRTLDRCAHFTSFPEHIDFVAPLRQDLDVLNGFAADCRERGWSSAHHANRMGLNEYAISPSGCYHCYEGMENWQVEAPGRCATMTLACHRYEGANHKTLSRLRAFTMREVVFIGQPKFVIDARASAEELIIQWAKDWELGCTFETANDMFFTSDFSVKASFQRLQQAKKELRLQIPVEGQSLSVFSSNFHAATFGKAFNITVAGRPATTGCIAWGYERWVYAIFSQCGFDVTKWPERLRQEYESHEAKGLL
jgi:hypothetical protein